jgi:hypothetical protein
VKPDYYPLGELPFAKRKLRRFEHSLWSAQLDYCRSQSNDLIKGDVPFPSLLQFGEDICSRSRGRRSSCKTEASSEELERSFLIFGSFAGGRRHLTGREFIDGEIGTFEQIPDLESARKAASLLVPELNAGRCGSEPISMTIAQLCSHLAQRELCLGNTWRSYSTKHIYKVYLRCWIIPKWGDYRLGQIRPVEVKSLTLL